MPSFQIGNRWVGDDYPPLVIAEIGINHGGSLDLAIQMADSAIDAGCEVIKHQTHVVEDEMSTEACSIVPSHTTESIYEIMNKCALDEVDETKLMQHINSRSTIFISTPFSRAAADRLRRLNVPAIKVGSGECNNYPLIKYIASLGKPVILSTGMNSIETISPSVKILRERSVPFALLHCTNLYPTPPHLVRLGAIDVLRQSFPDAVLGLSDHTTSNYTCLGAVALGASLLERHFTDNMNRIGPDIVCSMDPTSLSDLIIGSNIIFSARGSTKQPVPEESQTSAFAFASVVSTTDISPGDVLSHSNIWLMRPGGGDFSPDDYESLLGCISISFIPKGRQIKRSEVKFP